MNDEPNAQTANHATEMPAPAAPEVPWPDAVRPRVLGRLSRVPASELWPTSAALAEWLMTAPDDLRQSIAAGSVRFDERTANILLGTADGDVPICAVCESGPSSDEGLGVLLRVAAVQEGGIVAWVVGEPDDSHIAAVSWLNRSTSPRFHLVRAEGARVNDSAAAPMFDRIVRPPRGAQADESAQRGAGSQPQRRVEDHVPED